MVMISCVYLLFLILFFICRLTEDPKAYMKQFLEKLKDARTVQRNYPCIFDDSNVRSLFGMLDVTGKGFITYEQYKQGEFFKKKLLLQHPSFYIAFNSISTL